MSQSNFPRGAPGSEATKPTRIIKRYPNRKLYDIRDSCYVTLEEIADLIRDGEEVRVFDSKNHEDLTSVTLAQIIYEQEKKRSLMPLGLLISMVRHGGAQLGEHIKMGTRQVSSKAGKAFRKNPTASAAAKSPSSESMGAQNGEEARRSMEEDVASPAGDGAGKSVKKHGTGEWHRELDTRVRQTIEQLSTLPTLAREMEKMERKIRELEAKLEELDNT